LDRRPQLAAEELLKPPPNSDVFGTKATRQDGNSFTGRGLIGRAKAKRSVHPVSY